MFFLPLNEAITSKNEMETKNVPSKVAENVKRGKTTMSMKS